MIRRVSIIGARRQQDGEVGGLGEVGSWKGGRGEGGALRDGELFV